MADVLDRLPASDRRILRRLAEAAGVDLEVAAVEVLRAYLRLAKDAPGALPADPLARAARSAARGR